jgi:hypothetical protein
VKISVKASNVPLMIDAYRLLSETVDFPLHLGVTEAGPLPGGLVKSTAGIATLLAEGIGDTIRFSLTADPVEEAQAGRSCSRRWACASARASTSSPARSCGRAEDRCHPEFGERGPGRTAGPRDSPLQVAVDGLRRQRSRARRARRTSASPLGRKRGSTCFFVTGQGLSASFVPEDEMVERPRGRGRADHGRGQRGGAGRPGRTPSGGPTPAAEEDRFELLARPRAKPTRTDAGGADSEKNPRPHRRELRRRPSTPGGAHASSPEPALGISARETRVVAEAKDRRRASAASRAAEKKKKIPGLSCGGGFGPRDRESSPGWSIGFRAPEPTPVDTGGPRFERPIIDELRLLVGAHRGCGASGLPLGPHRGSSAAVVLALAVWGDRASRCWPER